MNGTVLYQINGKPATAEEYAAVAAGVLNAMTKQREAVLALHKPILDGHLPVCVEDGFDHPCPTARALGVTE